MMSAWFVAVASCLLAAGPVVFHARAIDGREAVGAIVAWHDGAMTLEADGRSETFRVDRLARLVARQQPAPPIRRPAVWIELRDGSLVAARQFEVKESVARITLMDDQHVELPVDRVDWVRFGPPGRGLDEQWNEIVGGEAAGDLIVVRRGGAIDFLEGILHDITPERVHFELDGDRLPVKREKLEGVVYAHSKTSGGPTTGKAAGTGNSATDDVASESGEALAVVVVAEGSRLVAAHLAWQPGPRGGTLRLITPAGVELRRSLDDVVSLDFSQGKVVYLSDLEWLPGESRWTPFFELDPLPESLRRYFAPRRDRGFDAPVLRVGGKSYARGLSLQSRTELVYRLPRGFRWFEAVAGIDDAHGESGHVQLVIEGDGQLLYSAEIRGGEAPVSLKLDIDGVRRLRIVVDFAGDLDVADCLNLCDARLLK